MCFFADDEIGGAACQPILRITGVVPIAVDSGENGVGHWREWVLLF